MLYHFHLSGTVDQPDDGEGHDFLTRAAACREAVRSTGEYLRDNPQTALNGGTLRVEVTDSAGHPVFAFVARGQSTAWQRQNREPGPDLCTETPMPLYYMNIYNDDVTMDPEGVELADDEAAMARALIEVRALAADTVRRGHLVGHHRIEVTDAERKPIGSVRFDEAVTISA